MNLSQPGGGFPGPHLVRRGYLRAAALHGGFRSFPAGALPAGTTCTGVSGAVNDEKIFNITALDKPWELDPAPAPLRILALEPESTPQGHCDPAHAQPKAIVISYPRSEHSRAHPVLHAAGQTHPRCWSGLRADLRRYDPDVILTAWGDTWLLPLLTKLSKKPACPCP